MYRQISIDAGDADLQRIVWQFSKQEKPAVFRLNTVTYGVNCAPYLAIKVLHTLASDERCNYPEAAQILKDEFYVDDVLTGAETIADACRRRKQLQDLLKAGGFVLRKWNSNSTEVLQTINPADREAKTTHELQSDEQSRALGLVWYTNHDSLTYALNLDDSMHTFTKRNLLSDVAKLFDPLGFLAPIVIRGKIFIQKLWLTGLDWHEPLPEILRENWVSFRNELKLVSLIKVPRWIHTSSKADSFELHAFADASILAYAAVVYLKVITQSSIHITLLMAKTRVAPLKKVTIPRLELCAVLLAARLVRKVQDILKLESVFTYMWSDSTTTLWWIRSDPGTLKEFVGNRIIQIQDLTSIKDWRYVNTTQHHRLWWHGPQWLLLPECNWPQTSLKEPETLAESKPVRMSTAQLALSDWFILDDYSTLDKLLVITGWCQRFSLAARGKPHETQDICLWHERESALNFWVKFVQARVFKRDLATLKTKTVVSNCSKLLKLHPMLDAHGVLRIGGRLRNARIPFTERYPAILPSDNHFTTLIIRQAHERTLHGGTQATLYYVRRKFWVIDGRRTVKRIIGKCVRCFRYTCLPEEQIMGDLPFGRCHASHPFLHTGVDFAGPFNVRTSKGRGHRSYKGYAALFVCFATRAIHLELVSDMTTDAFLAALARFVAARGLCTDMYCDRGTTFVGAAALMKEELKEFQEQLRAGAIHASTIGINWHFIPPGAPHFGGLWEAGVKSMKHHLRRVVHLTTLTFEELYTVLKQIEACLNSRPISAMSDDPQDISALTPGHFLVGRPLVAIPEPNILDDKVGLLKRWKLLRQMHQDFWRRWSCEYLQQLQTRNKWHKRQENITIGQLVLVRDERLPPKCWVLGRITDVHAGADGVNRVATIKTPTTMLQRPITKLSILPIFDTVGGVVTPTTA